MNSDSSSTSQDKSFIPLTLISLSLVIFFLWQWSYVSTAKANLQTSRAKLEEFEAGPGKQLADQVVKANQATDVVTNLVKDLMELGKTDPAAKAIVNKYVVPPNPPAGESSTGSTAPSGSSGTP